MSVGSADLSATITHPSRPLCYSDGTNSGLVITVTSETSNSSTFTVEYPDYDAQGIWQDALDASARSPLPTTGVFAVKAAAGDDAVYVLAQIGQAGFWVYEHKDGVWSSLGSPITSSQGMYSPQMCWLDGALYVLGAKSDRDVSNSYVRVFKHGAGTSWTTVGTINGATTNYPALGVAAGRLCVLASTAAGKTQLYQLAGSEFQSLGPAIDVSASAVVHPTITQIGTKPAVVLGEQGLGPGSKSSVWLFTLQGAMWHKTQLQQGLTKKTSAASVDGTTYVHYRVQDQAAQILVFDSTGKQVASQSLAEVATDPLTDELAVARGVAYYTCIESGTVATIHCYCAPLSDLSSMSELGVSVSSTASELATAVCGFRIYCAVSDNAAAALKWHAVSELSTPQQPGTDPSEGQQPDPPEGGGDGKDPSGGSGSGGSGTNPSEGQTGKNPPDVKPTPQQPGAKPVTFNVIADDDRYGTAVKIAKQTYPNGPAGVVVAAGYGNGKMGKYADALAAGPLAAALDYPILLVDQDKRGTGVLPDDVKAYLKANKSSIGQVVIIGGESAVSRAQMKALSAYGKAERIWGADRYATALAIYDQGKKHGFWQGGPIIATSDDFPDALSASAYASFSRSPIFLVGTGLKGHTLERFQAALRGFGGKQAIIVGGTAAVSQAWADLIDDRITIEERLEGGDRYLTSARIAEFCLENGMTRSTVAVATGRNFPDALAAGPMQGKAQGPVVLVVGDKDNGSIEAAHRVANASIGGPVAEVRFVGGKAAILPTVRGNVQKLF